MVNRGKQKKGSSLIEIIISMAILSILMIPLSSAIIQLVKTNKDGEEKQIASYEGQKVLEEFKGYSEINLFNDKFELLNGQELKKIDKNNYKSTFDVTNKNTVYEVNVSVAKKEVFDNTANTNREKLNIDFNENNKVSINDKNPIIFRSNYMKIKISNVSGDLSRYMLEFYSINDESQIKLGSETVEDLHKKIVTINVAKEYTKDLNIEIENNIKDSGNKKELNFEMNVYKSEDEEHRGIIGASSINGNNVVRINRNLEVAANGILEQLYIINVNVKKEGQSESLFESSNTQNIRIS